MLPFILQKTALVAGNGARKCQELLQGQEQSQVWPWDTGLRAILQHPGWVVASSSSKDADKTWKKCQVLLSFKPDLNYYTFFPTKTWAQLPAWPTPLVGSAVSCNSICFGNVAPRVINKATHLCPASDCVKCTCILCLLTWGREGHVCMHVWMTPVQVIRRDLSAQAISFPSYEGRCGHFSKHLQLVIKFPVAK